LDISSKAFDEEVGIAGKLDPLSYGLWRSKFDPSLRWIRPMMQFRGYDGLTWRFYDEDGEKSIPLLVTWVEALKEYLDGDKIGPRVPVFFAGRPYELGIEKYLAFRNR
jgi:hypothetical protein